MASINCLTSLARQYYRFLMNFIVDECTSFEINSAIITFFRQNPKSCYDCVFLSISMLVQLFRQLL